MSSAASIAKQVAAAREAIDRSYEKEKRLLGEVTATKEERARMEQHMARLQKALKELMADGAAAPPETADAAAASAAAVSGGASSAAAGSGPTQPAAAHPDATTGPSQVQPVLDGGIGGCTGVGRGLDVG